MTSTGFALGYAVTSTGFALGYAVTSVKSVLRRRHNQKVDDVFGRLHKPGRKPVSVEEMDSLIRQKMRDDFQ